MEQQLSRNTSTVSGLPLTRPSAVTIPLFCSVAKATLPFTWYFFPPSSAMYRTSPDIVREGEGERGRAREGGEGEREAERPIPRHIEGERALER